MIILVPSIGVFTFIVYIVFGPYLADFHAFSLSLNSVLFFVLGQLNTEGMIRANATVAVIWSYILYFFLIFIFLSVFMSIFIQSYEATVKEYGYPSDFDELVKWEYRDYLLWMIDWLPEKVLKKLKNSKNGQANEENEQN